MDEAEVKMAYTSGELAHSKTRLDVIKQQELLIREEAKEREMVRRRQREGEVLGSISSGVCTQWRPGWGPAPPPPRRQLISFLFWLLLN